MGMWPFSKKKQEEPTPAAAETNPVAPNSAAASAQEPSASDAPSGKNRDATSGAAPTVEGVGVSPAEVSDTAADATASGGTAVSAGPASIPHDAVNGERGPYDGDAVNFEDFDFSDFSVGLLDLGSMKIPLPKESQVQVEMGEAGPKMLHIVTKFGRLTPVAFAAPRTAGQWEEASVELIQGVAGDGLDASFEQGPWGREVVGKHDNGTVRIIGVEGPRWMLRLTTTGPEEMAEDLAALAREMIARMFIYRGSDPILAGNSLPVIMPKQLVEQMQQAMKARAEQREDGTQDTTA